MIHSQGYPYRRLLAVLALSSLWPTLAAAVFAASRPANAFRPPAVPLVTSDPYLSIWSETDRLTDDATRHWTHRPHPLVSLIRVDGIAYRLMGDDPATVPALPQTSLQVTPTRSIYQFANSQISVTLTFMTAALPDNLNVLTRPLSYITWQVRAVDGAAHTVSLYDSAGGQIAVNFPDQKVAWGRAKMGPLTALQLGTVGQTIFRPAGDDTRIDWGVLYLTAPAAQSTTAIGANADLLSRFIASGALPGRDDPRRPRAANDADPTLAVAFDLGRVGSTPVSRHVEVAYDEVYNIQWFGTRLRPYWRRNGTTPAQMLQAADRDYPRLVTRCAAFDRKLTADLTQVGGAKYAQVAALAYRQALAATGISADAHGKPLLFTKENTSNGDMATVDVFFPTSPVFLLLNPTLAEASAVPVLTYAASNHWKFPNAPHDLGDYPNATGRDDGGEAMPVEESGNMLLLCDAIAQANGNADFVKPWWPQLTQWARFLEQYGLDPGDQLCTDDFMGHLAHNANLSVKAILALAAYGDLCRRRGDMANSDKYQAMARRFARHWVAVADAGDHSLLAFDKPGTWSQKYNMVWDKILGLHVFAPDVSQKEIAYYKNKLQRFGVPLDSRTLLGDADHSFFSASLADTPADFEALIGPFYDYLDQTTARLPLVDTYQTNDARSNGMHARSVVGGIFARMLTDRAIWRKWAGGRAQNVAGWASLPPKPVVTYVVPNAQAALIVWRYTTTASPPPANWYAVGFNDSGWKIGAGAFGTPVAWTTVRTPWTDSPGDLWLRRTFVMPPGNLSGLKFMAYYDEDITIYVNGVRAAAVVGFNTGFEPLEIAPAARRLLTPGAKITLAVHVHQTTGGQGVDVGLANITRPRR